MLLFPVIFIVGVDKLILVVGKAVIVAGSILTVSFSPSYSALAVICVLSQSNL